MFGLDSYLGLGSVNSFTQGRTGDARGRTENESLAATTITQSSTSMNLCAPLCCPCAPL